MERETGLEPATLSLRTVSSFVQPRGFKVSAGNFLSVLDDGSV